MFIMYVFSGHVFYTINCIAALVGVTSVTNKGVSQSCFSSLQTLAHCDHRQPYQAPLRAQQRLPGRVPLLHAIWLWPSTAMYSHVKPMDLDSRAGL